VAVLAGGVVAVTLAAPDAQGRRSRARAGGWDVQGRGYSFNINTSPDGIPVTSCSQVDATVRNGELARDEEVRNIPASPSGLQVSGAKNGPVYVTGSDRSDYQVTLCKFTAGDTADEARARLADLSFSLENGRVTVNGPGGNAYVAYVIVETPREAKLSVDVTNGPLDLRSVSGTIVARTLNGPLAVQGVSGEVDVQATNGPVSLSEGAGHMRVRSQNGPLTVKLSGTDWQGAGLDAYAQNGPLSLSLPENYRSGVLVDISSNSPFHCDYSACREARRDWDDRSRTLRFGSAGTPVVHVSAMNGPVSIGSSKDEN
jgi:DUF4097 and DUF4098 domain-containing protein YvlB